MGYSQGIPASAQCADRYYRAGHHPLLPEEVAQWIDTLVVICLVERIEPFCDAVLNIFYAARLRLEVYYSRNYQEGVCAG